MGGLPRAVRTYYMKSENKDKSILDNIFSRYQYYN